MFTLPQNDRCETIPTYCKSTNNYTVWLSVCVLLCLSLNIIISQSLAVDWWPTAVVTSTLKIVRSSWFYEQAVFVRQRYFMYLQLEHTNLLISKRQHIDGWNAYWSDFDLVDFEYVNKSISICISIFVVRGIENIAK